jgi:hypothetical protein
MDYIRKLFILFFIISSSLIVGCAISDPKAASYEYKTVMVSGMPDHATGAPVNPAKYNDVERLQNQGWEVYKCTASYPIPGLCHYYYSLRRPKAEFQPVP